jgi:hypothetical protein
MGSSLATIPPVSESTVEVVPAESSVRESTENLQAVREGGFEGPGSFCEIESRSRVAGNRQILRSAPSAILR